MKCHNKPIVIAILNIVIAILNGFILFLNVNNVNLFEKQNKEDTKEEISLEEISLKVGQIYFYKSLDPFDDDARIHIIKDLKEGHVLYEIIWENGSFIETSSSIYSFKIGIELGYRVIIEKNDPRYIMYEEMKSIKYAKEKGFDLIAFPEL